MGEGIGLQPPERFLALTRAAGAGVALLGVLVLLGWAFELGTLKTALPGFASMKANTALCFILSGLALLTLSSPRARRVGRIAAYAMLGVALATLVEYLLEVDLGIDQLLFRDPDTPDVLFPGRMAEATSAGFVVAGLAMLLGTDARLYSPLILTARALAAGIAACGVLGVLGHFPAFEFLISVLPYQTLALHTAFGFVVLGAGLLLVLQTHEPVTEDRRIGGLAALLLVLAAGATGLVSFATIGRQVQGTLAQGLTAALDTRIREITTNVALRTTRAEIITSRPNLLKHLRLLVSDPMHPEYRAVVRGVLQSFLPHGFSGIAVTLPCGWEVARAGELITWPALEVHTEGPVETSLLWREGVYLHHRLPLADARGPLGSVLAEQFLPNLTESLHMAEAPWLSNELLLCAPAGPVFRCFPSRHNPIPFTLASAPVGAPARLVSRAFAEGKGFDDALDYRGRHVLGAYQRLDPLGLVAVLKVDAEEVYAPAVQSFGIAALLTFLLAGTGAMLVQLRVRPLATALEDRVRERTADLQAARAEVTDLYENAPEMYLSVEAGSARIRRCNETLLRATGYSREEVLGKSIFDLYHPGSLAEARQSFAAFQETGELRDVERQVVRKDGSVIEVSLNATAVRDPEGRLLYSRSSWRDIGEYKRLEARFRAVVDASPSGMIAVDAAGRIVLVNGEAERLFGYAREELIGRRVELLVPERLRAAHPRLREGFLARPEARPMGAGRELYGRRKDGSEFPIEIGLCPFGDAEGRMVLAAVVDISERQRLDREIRAKELLRVFLDAAPIMMWMTDERYRAQRFNGEWLRFTGRSLEEELALPWSGAEIHPDDRPLCLAAYDRHLHAHTKLMHEYRFMDCHGDYRWIEEVAVPRFDPEGRYEGHVGCCVDVSERREQAERLGSALQEKEVLLAEVHHRVKNNLAVIASLLSLQSQATENPAVRKVLAEGEGRVRAMALIHQVLYEGRDFAQVDLRDYLQRLVGLEVTAYGTDTGRIRVTVEAEPVRIELARAIPCGLLVNELLSNALKHAFPGAQQGEVRVGLRRLAGDEAELTVCDDGVGLPQGIVLGETPSLGLRLAPLLAQQLQATLTLGRGPGTRFDLRFRYAACLPRSPP